MNLFIGCIDFDMTTNEDAILAFDLLSRVYCDKFREIDLEKEQRNEDYGSLES